MKRFAEYEVEKWMNCYNRKPLIVRGLRQIGKTWAINHFGKNNFKNVFYIDFEKEKDIYEIFSRNLNVHKIVSELELLFEDKIVPVSEFL